MGIKKSFLIICLIICLFSIAGVSAADANDSAITGVDDSQIELTATESNLITVENNNVTNDGGIISSSNDETGSAQNDLDKLGTNPGTYSDLVSEIGSGGDIELQHDYYTYDYGGTISITTGYSVIDGKGAIIDMAGSNIQVFNVNVHYVTIKNLTIKNARYNGDGAAIYFNSFQGTISDCIFVNNSATGNGGAIFWDGGDTVKGCVFVNNSATKGGAVYRDSSQGSLSSCVFVNNSAADGILYCNNIYHGANLRIIDNIFLNNDGVAISAFKDRSDDSVDYNWFGNNETNKHIKPIVNNLKLDYWLFLDATVSPEMISVFDPSTITFKLRYCNEYEVHDYDNGRLKAVNLTLTPTNGRTNTPVAFFGKYVLYYAEGSGIGTITASIENVAYTVTVNVSDGTTFRDLNGLINFNNNDTIILDRDYTYNSSFDDGLIDGVVINRPMTIIGNGYTINATGQARIFEIRSDNVTIINITFADGYMDGQGGAIRWEGANGNVSDCIFVNNSAGYYGGAISWHYSSGSTVSDCIFVNNSAEIGGGAFIWDVSGDGVVSRCIFDNNSAAIGGVIYCDSDDCVVCDCIFVNNSADGGGVMYWELNNGNVSSCVFVNNSADNGLFYFRNGPFGKNLSVNDNIFLNNDGTVIYSEYPDSDSNFDYNWFGHNATNYMDNPNVDGCNVWLFLNATANPDTFSISEASDIIFKLYAYDSIEVSEYDNSRLKEVNLTVTPVNGQVNTTKTGLDKPVHYDPASVGFDRIIATIENVACDISLTITDGTTFFDLNRTIGNNNGAIALDKDYTYNSTVDSIFKRGIVVGHAVTIIGNNHTINALNQARIFDVQADNVAIKNVTFINANTTQVGGAIMWNGAGGIVSDCVFANNTAFNAGAICWYPIGGGLVSGCIFVNNSADNAGAALWIGKNSNVSDSVFVNNHANAAVIVCSGNGGVVSGCSFVNNSAHGDYGAIFWDGSDDGTVSGCVFVNNSVDRSIIYFNNKYSGSNLAINNNIFLNNDGVAISFYKSDSTSNTDYNWFGHNATNYMDNPNVDGCNVWLFLNSTANPDIFPILGTSDITFKLYAYDSNGVYEYDNSLLKAVNLTVTPTRGQVNSTKVNLGKSVQYTADDSGLGYLTATIENVVYTVQLKIADGTTFWDLNNTINGNNNDTISLDRDYTYYPLTDFNFKDGIDIGHAVTLIGYNYVLNADGQVRIFHIKADNVTIENITFINAKATEDGGAIIWDGANGNVFGSSFVNNSASRYAGAILWEVSYGVISECSFVNNFAENGGAITWFGGDGVVSDCSFVNNSADYGAAVVWYDDGGVVSGCSFVNNSAASDGGAVVWYAGGGVVSGCSFVNNSASDDGGAIVWSDSRSSNGLVSGCSFVNNSVGRYGGAVAWIESYYGNISGCNFVNNHAGSEGGAVAWVRSDGGTVSDCNFVNNSAHDGGAIDWRLNDGGTVIGCSFVNNSADYAAAIIWDQNTNGAISGCIFVNNTDERAVIFFFNMGRGHSLSINDNIFLNNNALAIDFVLRDSASNADYNWFGHNATNYYVEPPTKNVVINNVLFLNATADPDSVQVSESSDILFKLYSYNSTGIFEYDNSRLQPINLTVTATRGDVDDAIAKLGETIKYNATSIGTGSVTAKIENAEFTIEINNLRENPNLSVESNEVTYSNNTIIAINYNSAATGNVNITLKGKKSDYILAGLDLNATISLGNIGADEYEVIVEYSGDENFTDAIASGNLTVNKANSTLTVNNIEFDYGDMGSGEISFTGAAGVDAKVVNHDEAIVYVRGNTITVLNLSSGNYSLSVTTIPDENHNAVTENATITVRKVNSTINVNNIVIYYGESVNVTVTTDGAIGITAEIDGENVDVHGNIITIPDALKSGNHTLTITTVPDNNHIEVTKAVNIVDCRVDDNVIVIVDGKAYPAKIIDGKVVIDTGIGKENTSIALDVSSVENYSTFTVNVNSDASGIVRFEISGAEEHTVYVDVLNGVAVMNDVLAAGDYTVVVTYMGDDRFNSNITSESFTIQGHVKKDTPISADANVNGNIVTITVNVNESATGFIGLKQSESTIYLALEDGVASYVNTFEVGSYNVEVTYIGDDNYNGNSTRVLFTVVEVAKENTTINIDVSSVEDYATFTVSVNPDATGIVRFEVSGAEDYTVYADVLNGVAVMEDVLEVGDYSVVATYMGDGRFNSNATSESFTIIGHVKIDTPISAKVNVNGYKVTITVDVDENATGFVNIKLIGDEFNVALVDGAGSFAISLPANSYMIDVTYLGDDNFNQNSTKLSFTVEDPVKENTTISIDVSSVEDYATFTVSVNPDATGIVKFEVSGAENYTVYADVLGGVAVMEDALVAGDYTVVATYLGDDRFNSNITSESFSIQGHVKKDTPISADAYVNGNRVTITVNVDGNATGFVRLKQSGSTIYFALEDGVDSYVNTFAAGSYNVEVTYLGDYNYNENSTRLLFTVVEVAKKNTTIGLDVETIDNMAVFTVDVNENATGIVKFELTGDKEYISYLDVEDGKAVMISFIEEGNYTLTVTYMGDDRFNSNTASKSFNVIGHVKKDTPINAIADVNGNRVTVTVNVNENATGFVNMNLDGTELNVVLTDGVGFITINLPANSYSTDVTYLGDDNFNQNSTKLSFTVEDPVKENTTISIDVSSVEDYATFTVSVNPNATGIVKFEVSGAEYYTVYADVLDGVAVMEDMLEAGDYTVVATYMGDGRFNSNITSESFTIRGHIKKDTPISADAYVNGNRVTITVNVDGNATGFVRLKYSGSTIYIALEDGVASYVNTFAAGSYNVEVTYLGDYNYNENSTRLLFTVVEIVKKNTSIELDVSSVEDYATFTVSVNPDASGIVRFDVSGALEYVVYVDVLDGVAVMKDMLDAGDYTVVATYLGDDRFNSNVAFESFTVKGHVKNDTSISADVKVNGSKVTITVNVDENVTGIVKFIVTGAEEHALYVDVVGGKAVLEGVLESGNYTLVAAYMGDDRFNENVTFESFTVNVPEKQDTNVSITVPSDIKVGDNVTVEISVPNATGNISVFVDGVPYSQNLTNGKATVTIPELSEGSHNITVAYSGDGKYAPSSKSSVVVKEHVPVLKLTASNLSMLYTSGKYFKVRLTSDGKPLTNKKVKIRINGKTYTKTTDKNGYASIKISLAPKTYTVKATYGDLTITKKVTVKSIIKAKNVKAKRSAKTIKIKVTLKKVNGKYLKKKKVTLKFNKKTYKVKTNKKGVATFTIKNSVYKKLKVNKKYTYQVIYGKDKVKKTIKFKK